MGTKARRERERKQRRADILDAARKVFWDKGYDQTSVPDIAEEAELAAGTLYLYFPSKEALYSELVLEGLAKLERVLKTAARKGKTRRERLEALHQAFISFAKKQPEYFEVLFFVVQRTGRQVSDVVVEEDLWARLEAAENACKAIAADALRHPGLDGAELAHLVDAVWSMLVGVVFYFRARGDKLFESVARQARDVVLHGVLSQAAEGK